PMLVLGALALGDVSAAGLILDDGTALIEESTCRPMLPAQVRARTRHHLVLARRHGVRGSDRAQQLSDRFVALGGKEVPEAPAHEILRHPLNAPADRAVDERVRAVGTKPADQLRLIFDDRPILRLATA